MVACEQGAPLSDSCKTAAQAKSTGIKEISATCAVVMRVPESTGKDRIDLGTSAEGIIMWHSAAVSRLFHCVGLHGVSRPGTVCGSCVQVCGQHTHISFSSCALFT